MSNRSILSIGQQVYGYTIEKHLGSGAFANVYLASKTNASGKHTIALKHIVLPNEEQYNNALRSMEGRIKETEEHFSALFNDIIQEIETFKMLSAKSNNHIITYFDNDIDEGKKPLRYDAFIKMEYATPIIKQPVEQQLTVKELLKMAEHILQALKVCHDNGVIHRDIKDDNLFINNDGMYKIADFGVSTLLKKNERAKTQKGTLAFVAPEVMQEGQTTYDHTVDLYSLGIVLYKFFNSNRLPLLPNAPHPYTMDDIEAAVANRLKGATLPAPIKASDVVAQFILKACALRANRFNSTTEMLEALQLVKAQLTEEQLNEVVLTLNVMQAYEEQKESVEEIHEGLDLFNQSNSQNDRLQDQMAHLSNPQESNLGHLGETKAIYEPQEPKITAQQSQQQNLFGTNKARISNNEVPLNTPTENVPPTAPEPQQSQQPSPVNVPSPPPQLQANVIYDRGKTKGKIWPYVAAIAVLVVLSVLKYIKVFLFIETIPVVSTLFNHYIMSLLIGIALIIVLFKLGKKLNEPDYNESLYVRFKGSEVVEELVSIQTNLNFEKSNPAMNQQQLKEIDAKLIKLTEAVKHAGDFGLNNPKVFAVEKEIGDEIDKLNQKVKMYTVSSESGKEIFMIIDRIQQLLKKRKVLNVK